MLDILAPGFKVGHFTDEHAATGCTVVLPPAGNVTSCEIRGSSPGSRELVSLDVRRRLTEVHAVLLSGGSAFGLAAADGVMQWLAERGIGYETTVARVPIVPAAVIFDLGRAGASRPPGPDEGRRACDAAVERPVGRGRVGAGTGATVGKWAGPEHGVAGGVGIAAAESDGMRVGALAVVNAVGNVLAEDGTLLAGSAAPPDLPIAPRQPKSEIPVNTVLVVVATHGLLDKREVQWLAARATDGVTKSVEPAHTRYDGDVTFAIAAPPAPDATPVDIDVLGALACNAVARAVRDAVRPAD
ncbi:MAG: P1 family peptidase, partial [Actinomycetota bacterium]